MKRDVDLRRNPWRGMYREYKERLKKYGSGGFIMIYWYSGEEQLSTKLIVLNKRFETPCFLAREERFSLLHNIVRSFKPDARFSPPIIMNGDDCGWVYGTGDVGKIQYPSDDVSVEDFEIQVTMSIL